MDGFELPRRLRSDPATQTVVILTLTAYAMKGDKERARAAGCDAFVSKPIDTRLLPELIPRLRSERVDSSS
jgi:two-component system cell cycle response regulator DivK